MAKHFSRSSDAIITDNEFSQTEGPGGGGGSGDATINYTEIRTGEQFVNFVNRASSSANNSATCYGKIMNDIDIVRTTDLDSSKGYYTNLDRYPHIVLEGNNHSIYYYCWIGESYDGYENVQVDLGVGLFGWVQTLQVSNLIINGYVKLNINSDNRYTAIGGVAGFVLGSATITNCHVRTEVWYDENSKWSPHPYIGGFVGSASGTNSDGNKAQITIKDSAASGVIYLDGKAFNNGFKGWAGSGSAGAVVGTDIKYDGHSYYSFKVNEILYEENLSKVSSGFSNAYINYDSLSSSSTKNKYVKGIWEEYYEAGVTNPTYKPYHVYGCNPNIYWLKKRENVNPYNLKCGYIIRNKDGKIIEDNTEEYTDYNDMGYIVDNFAMFSNWEWKSGYVYSMNFGVDDVKDSKYIDPNNYELIDSDVETSGKTVYLTLAFIEKKVEYILNFGSVTLDGTVYEPTTDQMIIEKGETVDKKCEYSDGKMTITITIGGESVSWTINSIKYYVSTYGTYQYPNPYMAGYFNNDTIDWWGTTVPDLKSRNSLTTINDCKPSVSLKYYDTEFN